MMAMRLLRGTRGLAAAMVIGALPVLPTWAEPPTITTTTPTPADASPQHIYTRVSEGDDGTLKLELASAVFAPAEGKAGPRVHLVSAVHVADKSFYEGLQRALDKLDLVLFEGVKPPGAGTLDATLDEAGKIKATKARIKFLLAVVNEERSKAGALPVDFTALIEGGGKRWKNLIEQSLIDAWGHPLVYAVDKTEDDKERAAITSLGPDGQSQGGEGDDIRMLGSPVSKAPGKKEAGLQSQLAGALGLTFQLDAMDSSKPNWRSCDMSIDELQAQFEAAGVKSSALFSMLDGSSLTSKLAAFFLGFVKDSPQLSATMKMMMVEMLGQSEDVTAAVPASMKRMMEVILKDRNAVVLHDLKGVMEKEPAVKDVAIFYGAGHMADLEKHLIADLGYRLESETWSQAIEVNPADAGMTPKEAKAIRAQVRSSMPGAAKPKPKKPD
jgi:hypothetical protein